jgi:hypothetical protein
LTGSDTDPLHTDPLHHDSFITYGEFGAAFFRTAVTRDRVDEGLRTLAGRVFTFGPVGLTPIGLMKVSAEGEVGAPSVIERHGEFVSFRVTVPVDLRLVIDTGIDKIRFSATVAAHLVVTARAAGPLLLVIDVVPPKSRDIDVRVQAEGLRASVLQLSGQVDREIKKAVARYISRELDKPHMRALRVIDVGKLLGGFSLPR